MTGVRSRSAMIAAVQSMEPRTLFAVTVPNPIGNLEVRPGAAAQNLSLSGVFASDNIAGTVVRFVTEANSVQKTIDLELFDVATATRSAATTTTNNFLNYVNSGRYTNTFFHRALNFDVANNPAQFLQGGGFIANTSTNTVGQVSTDAAIPLQFAEDRPNTRGTIAMARTTAFNSATSGFFFNTVDNSDIFNAANPYAVFGQVIGQGQTVLDEYSALQRINGTFTFVGSSQAQTLSGVPVVNTANGSSLSNLVILRSATVVQNAKSTFAYDVQSTDSRIVSANIQNGSLQLNFGDRLGTATVTLVAADLTGETKQLSFTIKVASPALAVSYNSAAISSGQTAVVNLGQLFTGQTASRTFSIRNTGTSVLNIGQITLPTGFNVLTAPPATLAAGKTATFSVAITTTNAATLSGNVSIASDANNSSSGFVFPVTATVGSGLTLGSNGVKSVTFVDTDGTTGTFTYSGPGTATLGFTGTGLVVDTSKSLARVGGTNVAVTTIDITGSTTASTLSAAVSKGSDGLVFITGITAAAPLKSIALKGVVLTDAVTVSGTLTGLTLARIDSAVINVSGNVGAFTTGNLAGSTVTFAGDLGTLTLRDVTDSEISIGGTRSTTASATLLSNSNLTLAGGLTGLTVKGNITGSSISVAGTARKITAVQVLDSSIFADALSSFSVTSKLTDSFAASTIETGLLGTLAIGQLGDGTNPDNLSSVTATSISSLSGKNSVGKSFSIRKITATTDIASTLELLGISGDRLEVTVG